MEAVLDAAAAKAALLSTKLVEDAKKRFACIKHRQEEVDKRCGTSSENPITPVLELNVGGTEITVRRDTLTMLPSRLSQMFSGRWDESLPRHPDKRIFLDMDPAQMRAVHNWLVQMKRVGINAPKPPHPREELSEVQSWGFDHFLKYLQLDKHLADAAPIDSSVLTTGRQHDRLLTMLRQEAEGKPDIDIELLFRASRDGQTFHAKCDNKGATVVVAKSKGGFIFGGYTDTPWDSTGAYKCSRLSFLFRLDGPGLVAPSMHPVLHHANAIHCHPSYGPTFGGGIGGGGADFHIPIAGQTAVSNVGNAYNLSGQNVLGESGNVGLVDYEVYAVRSTPCPWPWRDLEKVENDLPSKFKDLFQSVRALAESAQAVDAEADDAERELSEMEAGLQEEAEFIKSYTSMFQESGAIVSLNVSGEFLWTTRATLIQEEDSMLAAKFSPTWTLQEAEIVRGGVFFEEQPDCFRRVLQYLRLLRMGASDITAPLWSAAQRESSRTLANYLGLKKLVAIMDNPSTILSVSQLQRLKEWLPPGSNCHRLLFRARRDGFTSKDFHSKCDCQGATLIVAQTTSGFVVGGYSQTPWDSSGQWKASQTNFLFMLQGPRITSPSKHSIFQNHGNAILCNPNNGPQFGSGDLIIPVGPGPTSIGDVSMKIGYSYNRCTDGVQAVDMSDALLDYEVFGLDG